MRHFGSSNSRHVTDNWELTVKIFTLKWGKDNERATGSFRYKVVCVAIVSARGCREIWEEGKKNAPAPTFAQDSIGNACYDGEVQRLWKIRLVVCVFALYRNRWIKGKGSRDLLIS